MPQGRRKVHDYFLLLLCNSSIWLTEKHIFKIIIYLLIHQNYVISFEVYDGFIGQTILKLWRQESWPFRAAHITSIRSWTFRLLCSATFSMKLGIWMVIQTFCLTEIVLKIKVSKARKQFMAASILPKNQENSLSWASSILRIKVLVVVVVVVYWRLC